MNVCLSGFMGSGKSFLGRALADALPAWRFVDLDACIEETAGKSISDIFREEGEARFRALEQTCLERLLVPAEGSGPEGGLILSLGGGTLMTPACADCVREHACCIYLKASEDTLVERLLATDIPGRPLLGGAANEPSLRRRVRALLQARSATYEACADTILQTDGRTADDLLAALLSLPCLSAGI